MSGGYSTELWLSRADELHGEHELLHHIWEELRWEPFLHSEGIAVEVTGTAVTLTGTVPSYAERVAAEDAAKRVRGVRTINCTLEVVLPREACRSDAELAEAAAHVLAWDIRIPHEEIRVKVSDGVVTLAGTLELEAQRLVAVETVRNLIGVRDLSDLLTVAPTSQRGDLRQRVETSLKRHAQLHGDRIRVEAREGGIVLRGTVRSLAEREEAAQAARSVPGVVRVDDDLEVGG